MPFNRIFILIFLFLPLLGVGQTITTIAGNGSPGFSGDGSAAVSAKLYGPICTAVDPAGNIYIADRGNYRIRKVSTTGIITTIAGTGTMGYGGDGGVATAAMLSLVSDLALDASGNLYFGDYNNNRVRKINSAGIITTVAGNGGTGYGGSGLVATATSVEPLGLAIDASGNIYIGSNSYSYIRKVSPSGIISTIAGTGVSGFSGDGGPATAAQFWWIEGLALDPAGNLYATDYYTGRVRKISTTGIISTIAGNGGLGSTGDGFPATSASIGYPEGITIDTGGNVVFCDNYNHNVRSVSPAGIITTVAGTGTAGFSGDNGPATAAKLNSPYGVAHDAYNNLYISDWWNNRIRKIGANNKPVLFTGGHIQNLSVCQNASATPINGLLSIIDTDVLQPETWSIVTPPTHGIVTVAFSAISTGGVITPTGLTFTPNAGYTGTDSFRVRIFDGMSADTTKIYILVNPTPPSITGATTTMVGSFITLSDAMPGGIWISGNPAIAAAGSTTGTVSGISSGTAVITYTATTGCRVTTSVNVVVGSGWIINTIAGNGIAGFSGDGGQATLATMTHPNGIATDALGNIYTTDDDLRIRKIDPTGIISTIAGGGITGFLGDGGPATLAAFTNNAGICVDGSGNVYVADYGHSRIRKITPSGIISTVAGTGLTGYTGDGGLAIAAQIGLPRSVAVDGLGNLYMGDELHGVIRKVSSGGVITTIAGTGTPGFGGDGGPAIAALLNQPTDILIDANGNIIFADGVTERVRKISATGIISTIAGTGVSGYSGDGGPASAAQLHTPYGLVLDPLNNLYICDQSAVVRRVNAAGIISTFAGTAVGFSGDRCAATAAALWQPHRLAADMNGGILVTDYMNHRVRRISQTNHAPVFTGGHSQSMTVCGVAIADSINAKLVVGETDSGQTETWTVVSAPLHGTVVATFSAVSVIGLNTPYGLYYTPVSGYTGLDSFKIKVTDCAGASDSTVIHISVAPVTVGIAGPSFLCVGESTTYFDTSGGGTWTSGSPGVASVGLYSGVVTGIAAGVVTITYTITLSCGTVTGVKTITINPLPSAISGSASVCMGATANLTDAVAGGSWSSSNYIIASVGSSTGIVGGISAGTAYITYTIPSGCYVVSPVTVNPLPSVISGDLNVCNGANTSLVDYTPGGSWVSGNPAIAGTTLPAGTISGVSAGTASVSYVLATGCMVTATVTVNASPAAIGGPTALCIGSPASLTDATMGGVWSSSTPSVADVSTSGFVTPAGSGFTSISYTLPTGCYSSILITVNTMPLPITGVLTTCAGSSFVLADLVSGGAWSSSNTAVVSIDPVSGTYTGLATGSSLINYSMGPGCNVAATVVINPMPAAISGVLTACVGASSSLTDPTAGGTWSTSNALIAGIGSASGVVNASLPGTTLLSYTTGSGPTCVASAVFTVNPLPLAISGVNHICQGSTTSLSCSIGGTWSSSNSLIASVNPATGLVSGLLPGNVIISYTLPTGCHSDISFTVNALPAPITGSSFVCVGTSITLADATSGGNWSRSNSNIAIGSLSGVVNGASTGTSIVSYTLPGGCAATKTLTINSSPGAITGIAQVCPGGTTVLSNPSSGGTWSCSPGTIATVNPSTGVVTGVAAGNASVIYALGAGCTASIIVTVNPLPSGISGGGAVCEGGILTLSCPGGGNWSSAGLLATVGSSSGIVTGVAAGVPTITYTLSTGCQRTIAVTVNPLPASIGGPSAVCIGSSAALSDASPGGIWSSTVPATATIGSLSGIVSGLTTGTTTISYTLTTGCSTSKTLTVSVSPVAISGTSVVCVGSTTAFADLIPGGVWSSSLPAIAAIGSLSGIVTGLAPGVATISYSLGTGCVVTTPVTVNPGPAAITGSFGICVGATSMLADATPGGVWSIFPAGIASVSGSGLLTGAVAGTATVGYTVAGCTASTEVTVNATPAAITGAVTVCVGATVVEADPSPGGIWTSVGSAISISGSTGIVTGLAPGIGNITYSLGGCAVGRTITVNPLPVISGAGAICAGSTGTLSATITGGTWVSMQPAVALVGAGSGVVTGMTIGSATIRYTSPAGCIATKVVTVTTAPTSITGSLHVCVEGTTALGNGISGGNWSITPTSIAIIGSLNGIVTGVTPGTATVSYSLGSGCTVATVVTVHPLPSSIAGTLQVCQGASIGLINSTPGGIWSSLLSAVASVGSSTGIYNGIAPGVATIKYTLATGCSTVVDVTVNPLPAPIAGVGNLCAGLSSPFSDASAGGSWSTSFAGIATVETTSGLVTGVVSGAAHITYTLPTGCATSTSLIINPSPTAITGSSMLCIGATSPLADATPSGTWTSGSSAVATVGPTGVITGVSLGSASISYTVAGCPAIKIITVNALPVAIAGPDHVCVGGSISLTDAGGGIWTSSAPLTATIGSANGIVTGVTAGVFSVTYSMGVGCTVSMPVTVNPLPSPITGPASHVCAGSSISLTDATAGGVWTSSAPSVAAITSTGVVTGALGVTSGSAVISYTIGTGCAATLPLSVMGVPPVAGVHNMCAWGDTMMLYNDTTTGIFTSSLVSVINLGGGSGRVVANAPGTASITYLLPSGCTTSRTFTVNPLPNIILGTAPVCTGGSLALTDGTLGGTWSSTNAMVATVGSNSGIVAALAGGNTHIVYTLAATGCKEDTLIIVTPYPTVEPIAGSGSICVGNSLLLSDSTYGGVWSRSGTTIAITAGLMSGVTAGIDSVFYTVSNYCGTVVASTTVTINPLPDAGVLHGIDSMCVGSIYPFVATVPGGIWTTANANAAVNAITGVVSGVMPGMDTVIYTVHNAWCTSTTSYPINIIAIANCGALDAKEISQKEVRFAVWPNPATHQFVIENSVSGRYAVCDLNGQIVFTADINAGQHKIELPDTVATGVYVLIFTSDDGQRSLAKMVISE